MTKEEAIQAMLSGQKVTHQYFTDEEFIYMADDLLCTEDGARMPPDEFWKWRIEDFWYEGWSLFE